MKRLIINFVTLFLTVSGALAQQATAVGPNDTSTANTWPFLQTFDGGILIDSTRANKFIVRNTANGAGEYFSIESLLTITQPGNSGTHLYQSDQDFQIARGLHQDTLLSGDYVFDDPTVISSHLLYEFGEAGYQRYITYPYAGSTPATVSFSDGTPGVVNLTAHGLAADGKIYFVGTVPTELTATAGGIWPAAGAWQTGVGTVYAVKTVLSADTFSVYLASDGTKTAIDFSSSAGKSATAVASLPVVDTPSATSAGLWRTDKLVQTGVDANIGVYQYFYGPTVFFPQTTALVTASWTDPSGTPLQRFFSNGSFVLGSGYQSSLGINLNYSDNSHGGIAINGQDTLGPYIDFRQGAGAGTSHFWLGTTSVWTGVGTDFSPMIGAEAGLGINFFVNNSVNTAFNLDVNGNVIVGSAAIATTATDGFLYIETSAGIPTGTPTTVTGRVPLVYDTTNHQFWIYDGGWKQPKTPAGAALVTWQ